MRSSKRNVWMMAWGVALIIGSQVAPAAAAPESVVATVGPSSIVQGELDQRAAEMEQAYRARLGRDLPAAQRLSIRRQALEILIRQRLYRLEAGRIKVPVPDADVATFLKRMPIFNPGGKFSERAWDNAQHNDPVAFRRASDMARRDLGAQRLAEELSRRNTPSDDQLRRAATRALAAVDLQYLPLPRPSFSGRYREPSEREVIEEYRAHVHEFERPAAASLHTMVFDAPSGDTGDRSRLRARADSAIAALRSGMPLTEAADRFGTRERTLMLQDDNLPGSWRGTAALNARIFRATPGTLIDEPVPSATGFYVVQVDSAAPRRPASLAEASPIVRNQLRQEIREHDDDHDLTQLYQSVHDSLSRPGYRVRVAVIEAARTKIGDPSEEDLSSFYQARLADYSRFDPATQSLVVRPLAEVRTDLIERWKTSRRDLFARDLANRVGDAWSQGRRDRALEAQAKVFEPGAVAYGAALDLGAAAAAVTDSLRRRAYDRLLEVVPFPGGYATVNAYELVEHVTPTLDQVRGPLLERLHQQQEATEIARSKRLYEQDPDRYLTGKLIYYSRLWCPQPQLIDVPMTRQEMETYYRQHITDYASPERFRVRHILIRLSGTGADADRKARERAEELLKRIRGGEDMGELARRASEDDKSRDDAGDLGYRSAGEMTPELQKVAFALKVGQVSDVVRATDGYHILQVTEHLPEQSEPLAWVYTTVGADAALKKAQNMARHQADSLAQVIRSPDQGKAVAQKLKLQIEQFRHRPGDRGYPPDQVRMVERLERMKPGDMYPGSEFFIGIGAAVMWVDSIARPHVLNFDEALTPVLLEYRRRMSRGAITAKQAELDSLLRAGWSFDSLGALWGGLKRDDHYTRHEGLPNIGADDTIDSLAFGEAGSAGLKAGALSEWLDLPDVTLRLRVNGRNEAEGREVESQIGQLRGIVLEYRLQDELKSMKQRFPVRILDGSLRNVTLPPLPPMPDL